MARRYRALPLLLVSAWALSGCKFEWKAVGADPSCELLAHLHGMAVLADQAYLRGDAQAFILLGEHGEALGRLLPSLSQSDKWQGLVPRVEAVQASGEALVAQREALQAAHEALTAIRRQSSDLLEISERLQAMLLMEDAKPAELAAAGQLVMLTQRLGKSAVEFLTLEGVSPEGVFLLGKDGNTFEAMLTGLRDGNAELHLRASKSARVRGVLAELAETFAETRKALSVILWKPGVEPIVAARQAQAAIVDNSLEADASLMPQCARSRGR